jgi:hypothetical protein
VANLVVAAVWMIPTMLLVLLTVAMAGMTPPVEVLAELFFLVSPPALFMAAAALAAPPFPGPVLLKAAGSVVLTVIDLAYLTHNAYACLPITFVFKAISNPAGAHR